MTGAPSGEGGGRNWELADGDRGDFNFTCHVLFLASSDEADVMGCSITTG